jgi:hypothetical protein
MNFKEWFLEGEYGTSASGPIDATFGGSTNFTSPNDDPYVKRGIRSAWQSADFPKKKISGRGNAGSPLGAGVVSVGGLQPWRGVQGAAI